MTLDSTSAAPVKADARGVRQPNRPRPDSNGLQTDVMIRQVARDVPEDDKYFDVPCTD